MEKLLKSRTLDECIRDAWHEVTLKPYIPYARSLVTFRRLVLQYWRDVYDRIPWQGMFLVIFTIFMTCLFQGKPPSN
jgi:hypothetical protein